MSRKKSIDSFEQCLLAYRVLKRNVLGEGIRFCCYFRQYRQERLNFGCEIENTVHHSVIKRFDSEAVPRCEESFAVPNSEGKHPAQMGKTVNAPPLVGR